MLTLVLRLRNAAMRARNLSGLLLMLSTKKLVPETAHGTSGRGGSAAASAPAHSALHFARAGAADRDASSPGTDAERGPSAGGSADTPFAMQHPLAQPAGVC